MEFWRWWFNVSWEWPSHLAFFLPLFISYCLQPRLFVVSNHLLFVFARKMFQFLTCFPAENLVITVDFIPTYIDKILGTRSPRWIITPKFPLPRAIEQFICARQNATMLWLLFQHISQFPESVLIGFWIPKRCPFFKGAKGRKWNWFSTRWWPLLWSEGARADLRLCSPLSNHHHLDFKSHFA